MSNMELSDQLCPVCQTRFLTKPMYSQGYHTPENVGRMYQKVRTCHHISPFHTNASQCPANTHDEDRLCTGFVWRDELNTPSGTQQLEPCTGPGCLVRAKPKAL